MTAFSLLPLSLLFYYLLMVTFLYYPPYPIVPPSPSLIYYPPYPSAHLFTPPPPLILLTHSYTTYPGSHVILFFFSPFPPSAHLILHPPPPPHLVLLTQGHTLFGLDQAKHHIPAVKQTVMVEGYFDVIAMHDVGVVNAVGTLGTAVTKVINHTYAPCQAQ